MNLLWCWGSGWYAFAVLPFYCGLLVVALRRLRLGGASIGGAVGLLLAGIPLVDAMGVASHSLGLALAFVAAVPVLRYWQRWVAAT